MMARMTAKPTMGGIDGLNKNMSVCWCASQLFSQVGRDNGTRAACPCRACDRTDGIRSWKTGDDQRRFQEGHPESSNPSTRWDFQCHCALSSLWRPFSLVRRTIHCLLFSETGRSKSARRTNALCPFCVHLSRIKYIYIVFNWGLMGALMLTCSSLSISGVCRERGSSRSARWGINNRYQQY